MAEADKKQTTKSKTKYHMKYNDVCTKNTSTIKQNNLLIKIAY